LALFSYLVTDKKQQLITVKRFILSAIGVQKVFFFNFECSFGTFDFLPAV
jgi:hypothetical protein